MKSYIIFAFIVMFTFVFLSCGEEEETAVPTTGTVSGTVTFLGTPPPGENEVQVSLFATLDAQGRPAGPPDFYSDPLPQITGTVPYTISGVSFGTYKLVAVGWELKDSPPGTPEIPIGMYGFNPPTDNEPDPITVSKDNPDITGIDIIADYNLIKPPQ